MKIKIGYYQIDKACYNLLRNMSGIGEHLDWNMESIGDVRDAVIESLKDVHGVEVELVDDSICAKAEAGQVPVVVENERVGRFTVHLMTPYCTWENVEAKDEDEAIKKCEIPPEFDGNEPHSFMTSEEEEDEKEILREDEYGQRI